LALVACDDREDSPSTITPPQAYIVRLILTKEDGAVEVRDLPLSSAQGGELRFRTNGVADAVLGIAGATEGTNQTAPYIVELIRQ
jgi:hypothetical protein